MKSSLPLVSIVTPSFNQAAYLEQTILSVLDQNYPNLEYGIVDGGSTDGSLKIIKKYEKQISWWISEKDKGQADAINKGLFRAKGEILAWLNSDDLYLPGAIQSALKQFADCQDAALVHGDVLAIDAKGTPINHIRYRDEGLPGLVKFDIIGQPAVFFRRQAFLKSGGLDLDYYYLLDHQLWLKIGQSGRIVYTPELWAKARFHSEAKNIASAAKFGDEAKRILEWIPTQPGLRAEYENNENRIKAGAYRLSGRYLLDAGQPRNALSEYGRSFRYSPLVALKEFHRILFALLSLIGLSSVRSLFVKVKQDRYRQGSKKQGIG